MIGLETLLGTSLPKWMTALWDDRDKEQLANLSLVYKELKHYGLDAQGNLLEDLALMETPLLQAESLPEAPVLNRALDVPQMRVLASPRSRRPFSWNRFERDLNGNDRDFKRRTLARLMDFGSLDPSGSEVFLDLWTECGSYESFYQTFKEATPYGPGDLLGRVSVKQGTCKYLNHLYELLKDGYAEVVQVPGCRLIYRLSPLGLQAARNRRARRLVFDHFGLDELLCVKPAGGNARLRRSTVYGQLCLGQIMLFQQQYQYSSCLGHLISADSSYGLILAAGIEKNNYRLYIWNQKKDASSWSELLAWLEKIQQQWPGIEVYPAALEAEEAREFSKFLKKTFKKITLANESFFCQGDMVKAFEKAAEDKKLCLWKITGDETEEEIKPEQPEEPVRRRAISQTRRELEQGIQNKPKTIDPKPVPARISKPERTVPKDLCTDPAWGVWKERIAGMLHQNQLPAACLAIQLLDLSTMEFLLAAKALGYENPKPADLVQLMEESRDLYGQSLIFMAGYQLFLDHYDPLDPGFEDLASALIHSDFAAEYPQARRIIQDLARYCRTWHISPIRYASLSDQKKPDSDSDNDINTALRKIRSLYEGYILSPVREKKGNARLLATRASILSGDGSLAKWCRAILEHPQTCLPALKDWLDETMLKENQYVLDERKLTAILEEHWYKSNEACRVSWKSSTINGSVRTNLLSTLRRFGQAFLDYVLACQDGAIQMEKACLPARKLISNLYAAMQELSEKLIQEDENLYALSIKILNTRMEKLDRFPDPEYFYIDFLKTSDILLDDHWLPLIQEDPAAQLEDLMKFINNPHPDWKGRISQLLSTQDDYGILKQILDWLEKSQPESEDVNLSLCRRQYEEGRKNAAREARLCYEDFLEDLLLSDFYGTNNIDIDIDINALKARAEKLYQSAMQSDNYGIFKTRLARLCQDLPLPQANPENTVWTGQGSLEPFLDHYSYLYSLAGSALPSPSKNQLLLSWPKPFPGSVQNLKRLIESLGFPVQAISQTQKNSLGVQYIGSGCGSIMVLQKQPALEDFLQELADLPDPDINSPVFVFYDGTASLSWRRELARALKENRNTRMILWIDRIVMLYLAMYAPGHQTIRQTVMEVCLPFCGYAPDEQLIIDSLSSCSIPDILRPLGFRLSEQDLKALEAYTGGQPDLTALFLESLFSVMDQNYAGYSLISSPPYLIPQRHLAKALACMKRKRLSIMNQQNPLYYPVSLILAANPENLMQTAADLEIKQISSLSKDALEELLQQMVRDKYLDLEPGSKSGYKLSSLNELKYITPKQAEEKLLDWLEKEEA